MPLKELKELLPTPAKSHYTFNLRDVSTVFQGFCQGTCESLPKSDDWAKGWYHECERVFWDRLATEQDHGWLFSKLKSTMNSFGRVGVRAGATAMDGAAATSAATAGGSRTLDGPMARRWTAVPSGGRPAAASGQVAVAGRAPHARGGHPPDESCAGPTHALG